MGHCRDSDPAVALRFFDDNCQIYGLVCNNAQQEKGQFWQSQQATVAQNVQSHPLDTHPSLATRLSALGMNISDIREEELASPQLPALALIPDAEEQGKALTQLEAQWLVTIGAVVLPRDPAMTPQSTGARVAAQ